MRLIEQHPSRIAMLLEQGKDTAADKARIESTFVLTDERRHNLERILQREITEATSARFRQEVRWRENMRQYEGIPRTEIRNFPIEAAPNVELNISGIVVDTIYAQSLDILFGTDPIIRVRPSGTHIDMEDVSADIQTLANRLAGTEMGLHSAARHTILDDVKHGTGVYYVPWTERVRITDIARITNRQPRVYSPPLEDVLTPGGAETFDEWLPWVGVRYWLSETQMRTRRDAYGWDIEGTQTTSSTGYTRYAREQSGNTRASTTRIGNLYDVWLLFGHFDVDGDGIERDLLVYYNLSGNKVVHASWNPYDNYPIELMQYQLREHLIHGIGTVEMCSQFQESATMILNEFMANAMLANNRAWVGPPGLVPGDTLRLRPGKYLGVTDANAIQALQLADVYPGSLQALSILNQMWERRTGVNEVSSPRPSSMLGNRTPGITTMTLMQQANRRFSTAFDSMRDATAGAVRQGLYRYHERVRMGDADAIAHLLKLFPDPERGSMVLAALGHEDFTSALVVEMQASTATANAIQDRHLIQIAGILGSYYDKALQGLTLAATQGIPETVRSAALKAAQGTSEIIKRALSKFDQIRDAEQFVLDLEEEINALPTAPPPLSGGAGGGGGVPNGGGAAGGQGSPANPSEGDTGSSSGSED